MKSIFVLLIITLFAFNSYSQSSAVVNIGGYIYHTPKVDPASIITYCPNKEIVHVYGRYDDSYIKVSWNGVVGYMYYSAIKNHYAIRSYIKGSLPGKYTIKTYSNGKIKIHLLKNSAGTFIIPCKVNGLALNFIFDTGASDVSISLTEALFMLKNGFLKETDIIGKQKYSTASGEIIEGTTIVIRKLEFEGITLHNIKASIVHELEAPLLLGQSALSQLGTIQLDYANNELTIIK